MTDKLYYADTATLEVQELPYTRDRAMSVSPVFFNSRIEALIHVRAAATLRVDEATKKWIELQNQITEIRESSL